MKNIALIVVDMQNALVNENPYAKDEVIHNIKKLISSCRTHHIEVIYVQHCESEGPLVKGQESWEVYSELQPLDTDKRIYKWFSSSFRETELKEYLDSKGYTQLVITGMQTNYCVDATIKVAFEYAYDVIIPEKTNTTFDSGHITGKDLYEYHNYELFKDRFGLVESIEDTLCRFQ